MSDTVKFDAPVTVKAGQIQFVEACHPPLVAGEYKVSMSQVIKESKEAVVPWNSDSYASELVFSVEAPRFTLNPTDIHSVYPPSNQTGSFDNALPHVVFTRRTLPWERTLDGKAPTLGQAFAPWMGLLLVHEDELLILDEKGQKTNRKYEIQSLPVMSKDKDSLLFAKKPAKKDGSKDSNVLVPNLGQNGAGAESDPDKKRRAGRWEKEKWQYEKDETSEKEKEFCLAIDLPADLFKAIAPRLEDLLYLAHVRQIDTGDKEVQAINDRGWFSLVIGNRLPQADPVSGGEGYKTAPVVTFTGGEGSGAQATAEIANGVVTKINIVSGGEGYKTAPVVTFTGGDGSGAQVTAEIANGVVTKISNIQADKEHRVFLVSLEGHQDRLQEDWKPQPGQLVRLAVLGSWGFNCKGSNDFKSHMGNLTIDSLHLPFNSFNDNLTATDIVNGAYARGYTAFNHVMRQGERTVSWYRGPLVPLNYDKPKQIQEPVKCADELLRYDPDAGLFDVTYAVAWQLGRLLALQNHSFALALNRVRRALRAEAERQMRLAEIKALKNGKEFIEDSLMDQIAKGAGETLISAIPK